MSEMTVKTNNHWREFIFGYELTEAEREEFDYLDDVETHEFIRYKKKLTDPHNFQMITDTMRLHDGWKDISCNWQGYMSDSYFSGLLIEYSDDCEAYRIATYMS